MSCTSVSMQGMSTSLGSYVEERNQMTQVPECVAPDFVTQIGPWIKQHPRVSMTSGGVFGSEALR